MNTPSHATDTFIEQLHGESPEFTAQRRLLQQATAAGLIAELDSERRSSSTATPDELDRLTDQLTVIMGPDLQAFYDWNRALVDDKSAIKFVGRDECHCPLARYLSAQVGRSIDVGDDEASIDGFVLVQLKGSWLAFVKAFDAGFEMLEYVSASEVLGLFTRNAAAWGIRL